MSIKRYNATLRNLEYRLRIFKDSLPTLLEDIVRSKEDVIVSAIADDQLYRRGINGRGEKIMDYAPYAARTIENKKRKGQPTTRVTLRDTGDFHKSMHVIFDSEGFYVTSDDEKAKYLVKKYGGEIYKLTDKNFTRIVRSHIRKELVKRLKQAIRR
nr:MAG TPA: hypothetical protein [Caudoviricetes sp.]